MPPYVVLLGPPGAGKGTQAAIIRQQLGLAHVSSGDLFRDNIKRATALGKQVKDILARGDLVPDEVTIAMVRERLGWPDVARGVVLDGFPRTPGQAQALDRMLAQLGGRVDLALSIEVSEDTLVARIAGRWTCRAHGHIYHEQYSPPAAPGVCDLDGSELFQRDDQKAEAVKNRNQVYQRDTAPLIDYYRSRGLLHSVDGEGAIERVTLDLKTAVLQAVQPAS
ncbi:MAG: adenylate kinase [Chloroflexi bacterium]|nr:adenylate kinase [Chloroflexota bacterium]